jgi:hypothetical protein
MDARGTLRYTYVHDASGSISQLAAFQLHFTAADEPSLLSRPLAQPWAAWEFVAGMPGELMFAQPVRARGSHEQLRLPAGTHGAGRAGSLAAAGAAACGRTPHWVFVGAAPGTPPLGGR